MAETHERPPEPFTLRLRRYDPESGESPYWEEHTVELEPHGAVQRQRNVLRRADAEPEGVRPEGLGLAALERPVIEEPPDAAGLHEDADVDHRAAVHGAHAQLCDRRVRGRMGHGRRGRLLRRGRRAGAAERPRGDHERGDACDDDQGEHDHVQLDPPVVFPADAHLAPRARAAVLVHPEPRAVLVDVELAVEAEEVGVGLEEAADVRLAR